jgi:hypothetical protein
MKQYELEKAISEGKIILMRKYRFYGMWSNPKKVSGEMALKKSNLLIVKSGQLSKSSLIT